VAKAHDGRIDLLLTDVVMPGMNGQDLAKQLITLHPESVCLFMSGYSDDVIAHRGMLDEHVNFIQKPFTMQALTAKVREVLDSQ
jgi:YesN/AraC family two-component response regulator